jgi:hypothetical protein
MYIGLRTFFPFAWRNLFVSRTKICCIVHNLLLTSHIPSVVSQSIILKLVVSWRCFDTQILRILKPNTNAPNTRTNMKVLSKSFPNELPNNVVRSKSMSAWINPAGACTKGPALRARALCDSLTTMNCVVGRFRKYQRVRLGPCIVGFDRYLWYRVTMRIWISLIQEIKFYLPLLTHLRVHPIAVSAHRFLVRCHLASGFDHDVIYTCMAIFECRISQDHNQALPDERN